MAKRRIQSAIDDAAAAAASQWRERLPTASPAERQEFTQWLRQSPLHVREWLLSDFVDDALSRFDRERELSVDIPADDSNVIPLSDRCQPLSKATSRENSQRPRPWIRALAAMLTAVAVALTYFVWEGPAQVYSTGVGEQRTLALDDGSLVALNVKTQLRVDFSSQWRDIHLLSGQALFTVAHDPSRPFRVHVNGTTVNAVGTKFDVQRVGDRALVYVVEGRVRIEQPVLASVAVSPIESPRLPPVELTPGEGAAIQQDGEIDPNARINDKAVSAWHDRRLVFEERSLAEIAEEFAAYVRSPRLVVEGEELRGRLYTGSFDADRVESFIAYLERDASIEVERKGEWVVVWPATAAPSALTQ